MAGSVTYSTDRENEASKIFLLYISNVNRARGKGNHIVEVKRIDYTDVINGNEEHISEVLF